jgi:hypothetical protein
MHFSQGYWQFAEYAFQPSILAVCCACISAKDVGSLLNMHFSQGYWQFADHVYYFSQSIDSLLNMHFSQGYWQFDEHVFQPMVLASC